MHCGVYVGTRDSLLGKAALLMKEGDVVLAQFNDPACGEMSQNWHLFKATDFKEGPELTGPKGQIELIQYQSLIEGCDSEIRALKAMILDATREKDRLILEMEKKCLEIYGSHEDDGGMFHGTCIHCGANLG